MNKTILFLALTFGCFSLHAQTAVPAAAVPVAPPAPSPLKPLAGGDQNFARIVSGTLQHQIQIALAGKREKREDPDISDFSNKLLKGATSIWTPFVDICQKHKFNSIAIDVSKNQRDAIVKMSKLKGAGFRADYFKLSITEARRGILFIESSLPKIEDAELKKSAGDMLAFFKNSVSALETKSKEPFTPSAQPKAAPGKKRGAQNP